MVTQESYYEEFDEYIKNGEKAPADYADRLGISTNSFIQAVEKYKPIKEELETRTKPLTVTVEEALTPKHKPKVILSNPQKEALYEAIKAGGSWKDVAERFSVSISSVRNIYAKIAEQRSQSQAPAVILSPPLPSPEGLAKIVEASEVGVMIEGEFIVIRLPKTKVTRELLKGVLN